MKKFKNCTPEKSQLFSLVVNQALSLKSEGFSWKRAMKLGWRKAKILTALRKGIVQFVFEKTNGRKLRKAVGTLCKSYYKEHRFRGRGVAVQGEYLVRYWDLEKEAWRSFSIEGLKMKSIKQIFVEL